VRKARTQAFRQAPWRILQQSTGNTLLSMVALLVLAGMYLAVNARLADAGRELLALEARRSDLMRATTQLGATLADLTTPQRMLERAASLGFHPAHPKDTEYVVIEGYHPPEGFRAPPPIGSPVMPSGGLSPAYTETLADWTIRMVELLRGKR
jgi:hypothetical protein